MGLIGEGWDKVEQGVEDVFGGGAAGELQLGQTDDPGELIHGDTRAIRSAASKLKGFSAAFGETSDGLKRIVTSGHWEGAAADAFRARFSPEPGKWEAACEAMGEASAALESYAGTVQSAQGQARQAIDLWEQGQAATAHATAAYHQHVAAYNEAVRAAKGQISGTPPSNPGPFSDPGEDLRTQAERILSSARAARDAAAASAASAVAAATDLAPAQPSFLDRLGDDVSDAVTATGAAVSSFSSGVLQGVAGMVRFAQTLDPLDPWNLDHPSEYLAGLSGTLAGVSEGLLNPATMVKNMLGSGWGTDPFQSFGKLVPNLAVTALTSGAGGAADGAADAASAAGEDVASQSVSDMTRAGDPVNVATGDVVFDQADVTLPGALPLVVERAHRSSWRGGRWLGETWASTFDQRLLVAGDRIAAVFADGRVLFWHRNEVGDSGSGSGSGEALPKSGPAWPLRREAGGGYTVTDPRQGVTWRYSHRPGFWRYDDGQGEMPLVSVTDRAGHVIAYDYTDDGEPVGITGPGDRRISVTTGSGRVTGLALEAGDGDAVPLARYTYDDAGHLAGVVNSSGEPLRFTYDDDGRMTGWTDRGGGSYSYTYDEHGRCVRGESPSGALSGVFAYGPGVTRHADATGAVTEYRLDSSFRVTAVTDPLGNTTATEHDGHGRVRSRTDPLGRVTRYAYDDAGNPVSVTRPDGTVARAEYDERGLPVTVTDPDGAQWRQAYDERGNRVSLTGPDGAVTRYAYDDAGHLAEVTGPDGAVTTFACDAAGLLLAQRDPAGGVTSYERDQFGRTGRITGPDGSVTAMTWTIEGRPASRTFPDSSAETWTWDADGNLARHVSAAGAVTSYSYGAFGKISEASWPDGTSTAFAYDGELRLESVAQNGMVWRYGYDPAGRLESETDYNGAVTRYAYDDAGQLTRRVNAAEQETVFAYDPLGNVAEQRSSGSGSGSGSGEAATFGYDAAGRLIRARNGDAEICIERDALGRVIAETCDGAAVTTSYDDAGRVTGRITPSGAVTAWDYDAAGLPSVMRSGGGELRFGYDPAGREVSRELPGGAVLTQDWDSLGRLTGQVLVGPGPAGGTLQRRGYAYSPDGFATAAEDLLAGDRAFGLDDSGRVTGVTGTDWAERYAYDPLGNLASATWPATIPGAGPPGAGQPGAGQISAGQLSAAGPHDISGTLVRRAGNVSYSYDAAGRVVQRTQRRISRKPDTWRYEWDAGNRLTSVTGSDGSVWRYRYDPLGRRVAKEHLEESGTVLDRTRFAWDGAVLIEQAETVPGGDREQVTTWDYRPGSFTPLAQTSGSPADETGRRFHAIITDLTGTPSELVASDGTLAGHQRHTLWGITGWDPSGESTPLRFPGQYGDPETGLHYNNKRYYDPVAGAYLSPDPLGLAPAPNPHSYVRNPQVLTDPVGLEPGTVGQTAGRPDNQLVLSGHGGIHPGDGTPATVPPGTRVAMYSGHGQGIANWQGNIIERGSPVPAEIYGPGEQLPNYWLLPPKGLPIQGTPLMVNVPTRISDLLAPGMGTVHWAACRIVYHTLW